MGRHAHRQLRITDDDSGQHFGVKNDLFHMIFAIGQHPGPAHLRPGPGGGQHRDDRGDPVRVGAGPPVINILKIPYRAGLPGHEGDDLRQIQRGTAAEGDHAVMAAVAVSGQTAVGDQQGGLFNPSVSQASASSVIRPAPKRMAVG